MKFQDILKHIFMFLFFVAVQVLWVKPFVFYDLAFCFIYLAAVVTLPLYLPTSFLLLLAFGMGITVDLFYDTIGIHAAACVAVMFARYNLISLLTPLGGYDANQEVTITDMGFRWFIVYLFILTFFHHFIVFILEANTFSYFYWTFLKVFCSTIFTVFMITAFLYLFFSPATQKNT
jgi:hypothetical protein